ncbi:MAG: hypothetical protein PF636_03360, partial [Actinomycetota bacterium]|nr:hypothetical protein [Actinomycetota bacterium]
IWNASGDEALTSAGMENYDSFDGLDSSEYIDFKNYADLDLSQGDFIVSVYFADGDDQIPSANVTLIVTKPDGSTEQRSGVVYWEIGMDQWHAFSINAETGEITDMDTYIDVEVTE